MKASDVILDLLRTYGTKGTTAYEITATGELFGFTKNSIRVNLSRLVARKKIESQRRGQYRLRVDSDPINDFAESWRLGESRVQHWSSVYWTCVHLENLTLKSKWALTNYGFREASTHFWIRPDNLSVCSEQLKIELCRLGLAPSAILIEQAKLDEGLSSQWILQFNLEQIQDRYIDVNNELTQSLDSIHLLSENEAKKECFQLGGKAIALLAKDPLIPEQFLSIQHRAALWQTLIQYDEVGRKIWASHSQQVPDRLLTSKSQYIGMSA
jgi:phenylacetic acid degradation operon negative regulatory protein